LEKRLEALEKRAGVGVESDLYVLTVKLWKPDDPDYHWNWLMRPTPDGKGEVVRKLSDEEAKAFEQQA
jgi:hypothetical protein